MLSQWCVVGGAESQVTDETDDCLDERPAAWWVEQLDDDWQTVVQADGVLSHLGFRVTTGEMSQSTDGWFCDVLSVSRLHDGSDESLDTIHLAHDHLVALVVACQVTDNASSTGDNVDVV